jgi:hypothetical protein
MVCGFDNKNYRTLTSATQENLNSSNADGFISNVQHTMHMHRLKKLVVRYTYLRRTIDQHVQHKNKKGDKKKREENTADNNLLVEGG